MSSAVRSAKRNPNALSTAAAAATAGDSGIITSMARSISSAARAGARVPSRIESSVPFIANGIAATAMATCAMMSPVQVRPSSMRRHRRTDRRQLHLRPRERNTVRETTEHVQRRPPARPADRSVEAQRHPAAAHLRAARPHRSAAAP